MAAQAYADQPALRLALRYRVGQYDAAAATDSVLSDAELDEALDAGRNKINKSAAGLSQFGSFQVVAAQQRYTAAQAGFPSSKLGRAKIFWNGGQSLIADTPSVFGSIDSLTWLFNVMVSGNAIPPYIDETRLFLASKFNATVERYFGGRGWEGADDYVWLSPIPAASGTSVYWLCPIERYSTALAVTREHSEALMCWAAAQAFTALSAKASEMMKASDGGLVSVWTDGGVRHAEFAKQLKAEFWAQFRVPSAIRRL